MYVSARPNIMIQGRVVNAAGLPRLGNHAFLGNEQAAMVTVLSVLHGRCLRVSTRWAVHRLRP